MVWLPAVGALRVVGPRGLGVGLLLIAAGEGVAAQPLSTTTLPGALRPGWGEVGLQPAGGTEPGLRTGAQRAPSGPRPLRPAGMSLLVPGLGQRALGQWRGWVYLSVELVGWALYVDRRRAAADYRDGYRDFAWANARLQTDPRRDPAFPYYETLSHWQRSGAFDTDLATEGIQPEGDATTYNGAIWARAVGLFLGGGVGEPTDPGYETALGYYRDRAWGPEYLWDWSGTGDAMGEFAGLIESSDDRARQATNVLGVVIANHLVAAVDAYLSARGSPVSVDVRAEPREARVGARWEARVRWRAPR